MAVRGEMQSWKGGAAARSAICRLPGYLATRATGS